MGPHFCYIHYKYSIFTVTINYCTQPQFHRKWKRTTKHTHISIDNQYKLPGMRANPPTIKIDYRTLPHCHRKSQ